MPDRGVVPMRHPRLRDEVDETADERRVASAVSARPEGVRAPAPETGRGGEIPSSTLMLLQRASGNRAVARLLQREPPAGAPAEAPAYHPQPTFPTEGATASLPPPKGYDISVVMDGRAIDWPGLSSEEAMRRLNSLWSMLHGSLDNGRRAHSSLKENREDHWVVGFWSDTFGGVELPDIDMWNEVGRGPLWRAKQALDASEEVLKAKWEAGEAVIDRGLPDALKNSPLMAEALAFDATRERINGAVSALEEGSRQLEHCWKLIEEYAEGTVKGAERSITGIKVSIVVLSAAATAGAGGALGQGAGLAARSGVSALTGGGLGMAEETFTQIGEMSIDARSEFDFGKIAKRGAKDVVAGFIGGVVAGKFSNAIKGRMATWVSGLSDDQLLKYGIAREELLSSGERFFAEWVSGIGASPFSTTSQVLMDRALEGKWNVKSFGDFAGMVFDDMVQGAAMDGFLEFGGRAAARTGRSRGQSGGGGAAPPPSAGEGPVRPGVETAPPVPIPAPRTAPPEATVTGGAKDVAPPQGTTDPARPPIPEGPASRVAPPNGDLAAAVMGHPGAGLRSGEAVANVAEAIVRIPDPAPGTSLQSHAEQIVAPINAELARIGVPPPRIEVVDLQNPELNGLYDSARNVILINEGAMWEGRPVFDITNPQSRQQLVSIAFHEARHIEQTYHALRHMALHDPASLAGQVADVHPALIQAAQANPLPPGRTADSEMARRAYEEMFGTGEARQRFIRGEDHAGRQRITEQIQQLRDQRTLIQGQIDAIKVGKYSKSGPQRRAIADIDTRINRLNGELADMEATYWRLYVEVDARGAEADLARELGEARQRRRELDRKLDDVITSLEAEQHAPAPLEPAPGEERALADAADALQVYRTDLERLEKMADEFDAPTGRVDTTTGGPKGGAR